MIVPPPYTNRNLIQEGWTELCPHPNLEKAVIERSIAHWGVKFKNATSDNSWFFAKRRLEHYNTWNKQWIQQYGTVPAILPGLPALPGRRPSISSMAANNRMGIRAAVGPSIREVDIMNALLRQEPTDSDILQEMDYFGRNM